MAATPTTHFDEATGQTYRVVPEALKTWEFSHGYDGWEFYVRSNGEIVAVAR